MQLMHTAFQRPLSCVRTSPGPATLPRDNMQSLQSALDLPLIFSRFRLNVYVFVLLRHICHMAPGPLHYCICPLWWTDVVLLRQHEWHADSRDLPALGTCWPCGLTIPEADRAPPLLYVDKVWFHLVLDYIVFSLVTHRPRCSGQKCLDFYFS